MIPHVTTPHRSNRVPPCESRFDLSGNHLDSEQRVRWVGPLPPAVLHAELPEVMDRLHFAAVQRSVFGAVRCEVRPAGVDCRLFGRFLALQFAEPDTVVSAQRVVRRWRITGGFLARPSDAYGAITFGWEAVSETGPGDDAEQVLWARVEGYPSRFVRSTGARRILPLPPVISEVYAWYHGLVTCRYLRRMAAWMMENAPA